MQRAIQSGIRGKADSKALAVDGSTNPQNEAK
jgi:hypothetical protein